jgi:hypothetical protein
MARDQNCLLSEGCGVGLSGLTLPLSGKDGRASYQGLYDEDTSEKPANYLLLSGFIRGADRMLADQAGTTHQQSREILARLTRQRQEKKFQYSCKPQGSRKARRPFRSQAC